MGTVNQTQELSKKSIERKFAIAIPEEMLPQAISDSENFKKEYCDKCGHQNNGCKRVFDAYGNCVFHQ